MSWLQICHEDGRFQRKIQAIAADFLAALLGLVGSQPHGITKNQKKSKIIATGCRTGVFYSCETV